MKLRFLPSPLIGALVLAGVLAAPAAAQAGTAACAATGPGVVPNGSLATSAQGERRMPCPTPAGDAARTDQPARSDAAGEKRSARADQPERGPGRAGPLGGALGDIARDGLAGTPSSSSSASSLQPLQNGMALAGAAGAGRSSRAAAAFAAAQAFATPSFRALAIALPSTQPSSTSAAGGCLPGFVRRAATPDDAVCVTPASRKRAHTENVTAAHRVRPAGATPADGRCIDGYVRRRAAVGDLVCVRSEVRAFVRQENLLAAARAYQ
ncbi:MAG: hypothetical protein ABI699_10045 [Caldimonas sp.]